MRWPQRVALCLVAALVLLLAAACHRRDPRKMLRITATPWIGNTPLMAARERGLFAPTEARIVELSTDFDVWRAILERRADMVTGTLIDVLRTIDHGADLKIVMALDFSAGADGIVAREGVADMQALRGRKVAVEKATLTHFVLIRALERAGMREDEITLENFAMDESLIALDDGRVDAATLWEPLLSHAKKPGRTVLFTSLEMPGEIIDVLAVRSEVLRDQPDAVSDIVRGFHEAVEVLKADPENAVETAARLMSLSKAEASAALGRVEIVDRGRNKRLFDRAAPANIWDTYALSARFMERHGMLRKPARAPEDVLDAGPLERASAGRK